MVINVLFIVVLHFTCIASTTLEEHWLMITPSTAGVGETVEEIVGETPIYCSVMCACNGQCNGFNYVLSNKTCTLLHMESVVDDWEKDDDVVFTCIECDSGPEGESISNVCDSSLHCLVVQNGHWMITMVYFTALVGLWTFIDQAVNLRNPSASITTFNTPFAPAVSVSSTNVISFLGHKGSYVMLANTGELAVSSFTWSAMIFPESDREGPLFAWVSDYSECSQLDLSIRYNGNQKFKFGLCVGSKMIWITNTAIKMSLNQWHEVAASYNAKTGYAQVYVDGNLLSSNTGYNENRLIKGPIVMGSTYHNNGDKRSFQGRIACMRLWNIARDLSSLRMDTPFCIIT